MNTLEQIKQNIKNWTEVRMNETDMLRLLNSGNGFQIDFAKFGALGNGIYIHAYPAISEGNLTFYLISSANDVNTGSQENLRPFIHESPIGRYPYVGNTDQTPGLDTALQERIELWTNHHNQWITNEISEGTGMFQAFRIPTHDTDQGEVHVSYFALKLAENQTDIFAGDLIIGDYSELPTSSEYDDTTCLVPPFGACPFTERSDFYLLNISLA